MLYWSFIKNPELRSIITILSGQEHWETVATAYEVLKDRNVYPWTTGAEIVECS